RRHTRFSRDWSSDVCSSDLKRKGRRPMGRAPGGSCAQVPLGEVYIRDDWRTGRGIPMARSRNEDEYRAKRQAILDMAAKLFAREIGRASCRERVQFSAGDEC